MVTSTIRYDSSKFKTLVESDHEVSALSLALVAHDILNEKSTNAHKTQKRIDFLLHEFLSENPGSENEIEIIAALNKFLFEKKMFKGFQNEPRTTDDLFISKVLESRTGHALTLSLVYRELTRGSLMSPACLINFPGYFFIKVLYKHQLIFLDPADHGRVLSLADLQHRLCQRFGKNMVLDGVFLETPTEIQTITRYLYKLKSLYLEHKRWSQLLTCLDMLIATSSTKSIEYRERGLLLYQLGKIPEALEDLNSYVKKSRPSPEVERIKGILTRIENPNVTPLF